MAIHLTRQELERHWPEQARELFAKEERAKTRQAIATVAVSPSRILRLPEPGETGPWSFTIPGWLPANLNQYLRAHWSKVSRAKKATADAVLTACIADQIPHATAKRRVSIRLTLPKGRRPPDHDNLLKSLYDALTAAGAIVDDSTEWCETGSFETEVGRLATTVTLEQKSIERNL